MKQTKIWICMLLALTLLTGMLPSAMAETEMAAEVMTVPFYSAYERAEQPGMYLNVVLNEDTATRMTTRLGQIAAANQDRFDNEETAATVIRGWFDSTHFNFSTMFTVSEGDSGEIQVNPNYLRMYDFVAIEDEQGRVMLYPFQLYSADLYMELWNAAIPVMQAMLDPLLDSSFAAIMETLEDEDMKSKLEVAYDELRPTFTVTLADVQSVLTEETVVREGVTLKNATNIVTDLTVSNLGALKPVKLATENQTEAWYKLSLSESSLTGSKLASPVSLAEIRNITTASATVWLNEQGELIYITASNNAMSADAQQLSKLLAEQGGTGVAKPEAEKEEVKSSSIIWYIIAILVVLAVGAAVWYALKSKSKKNARPRFASGGAAEAPKKEETTEE